MNNNIYYKIAKWGNIKLYRYKDTAQVELFKDNPGRPGIVVNNVTFSAGPHQLIFDLEFDFKGNDALFYTSDSTKKNKRYLKSGNNKLMVYVF